MRRLGSLVSMSAWFFFAGKMLLESVLPWNFRPTILEIIALAGLGSVQFHSSANKGLEGALVNLLAFMDVDGAPDSSRLVE